MKKSLRTLGVIVLLALATIPAPRAAAAAPGFVIVTYGDTLYSIAARNGTTVDALIRLNGLPNANFVFVGQRLFVPRATTAPSAPVNASSTSSVYVVSRGETLATIAARHGTTVSELMRVNGLYNPNFIYAGQRLRIPGRRTLPAPQPATAPTNPPSRGVNPAPAPTSGRWIDIDISAQTTTAYQGNTPLKSVRVSTGLTWTPTPLGRFAIYTKIPSQAMSGPGYYLPGVPWVMYFTGAYAIHGTYWHQNFGRPMSHGCVNLTIADAKWFYDWAEIGTPVVVHP